MTDKNQPSTPDIDTLDQEAMNTIKDIILKASAP